VEEAIATGDQSQALAAMQLVESHLMKAAQNGVMHKNSASRKRSRGWPTAFAKLRI
jgi:small subunit ribosomal protein S20